MPFFFFFGNSLDRYFIDPSQEMRFVTSKQRSTNITTLVKYNLMLKYTIPIPDNAKKIYKIYKTTKSAIVNMSKIKQLQINLKEYVIAH